MGLPQSGRDDLLLFLRMRYVILHAPPLHIYTLNMKIILPWNYMLYQDLGVLNVHQSIAPQIKENSNVI